MKFSWDVAPCSHVEVDRRFRGAYCLHHQGNFFFLFLNIKRIISAVRRIKFVGATMLYIS
jgi:hypothetical protein